MPEVSMTRRSSFVALVIVLGTGGCGAARPRAGDKGVVSACATGAPGGGDELAVAQRDYDQGQCFFERGEFGEAALAYRRAYDGTHLPEILTSVARAYRQAGNCREAVHYYWQYLDRVPAAPD